MFEQSSRSPHIFSTEVITYLDVASSIFLLLLKPAYFLLLFL